jgi:hypothetical protein
MIDVYRTIIKVLETNRIKRKRYIGPKTGYYTELFDKEGFDKNSQILNLLLVSFF